MSSCLIFFAAALVIFFKGGPLLLPIGFGTTGIISGVVLAESIRRRIGCSRFIGSILGAADFPLADKKNHSEDIADEG
ncbi:MAG: hypothetical protein P4L51_12745 [Puia sp.]|nr:hypothetical protein [Puia sp.]